MGRSKIPGCEKHDPLSPDYFRCHIKTFTVSGAHGAGNCGMGRVVDSQLVVKGTQRLRIADASIMPTLPNANIAWACFMIGEKTADLLIQKYDENVKK